MTLHEVPAIEGPDFVARVRVREGGPQAVLDLEGSADLTASSALEALVAAVHEAMVAQAAGEIVVEMRELELMSPAAFNALVAWVAMITELTVEQRYRIKFRSNPAIAWQDRFLSTLACFARDIVIIDRERQENESGDDGAA